MRVRFYWIALCVLVMKYQSQGQTISQFQDAMSVNDYLTAIDIGGQLMAKDSSDNAFNTEYAKACYLAGRYAIAKKMYQKVEQNIHDTVTVSNALMKIYELEQDFPRAVKYGLKLSEIRPTQAVYDRKVAEYHIASSYVLEGIRYMEKAYRKDSNDLQSVIALSELYYKHNYVGRADTITQIALINEPNHLGLRGLAAKIAMRLKKFDQAVTHLEYIRTRSILSSFQYRNLGYAYLQKDSINKAIFYLETSIRKDENMEYNYYYLALAYEKMKEYEKARNYYDLARREAVSENMPTYFRNKAALYAAEKRYQEAQDVSHIAYIVFDDRESLFFEAVYSDQGSDKVTSQTIDLYKLYIDKCEDQCTHLDLAKERLTYLEKLRSKSRQKKNG